MKSKLMLLGAASALLVSFACGCAAEMGTDEGTSTDPRARPADEKTGTTESPQLIYGNPAGYNPPGYNPYAPGSNPPGYNPPGMGVGEAYPGYGAGYGGAYPGYGPGYGAAYPGYGPGYGAAYPGYGPGYGVGYPGGGTNLNGGGNVPGPY
jgi:hypothetical protein